MISVRDEGVGVPTEELGRIFERFYHSGAPGGAGSSGLGLAIAKGFTEAFGGRIWAERPADPAGGLAVFVELPLADPDAGA